MRSFLVSFFTLFSILALSITIPQPTPLKYINDYVGVVNEEYVKKIVLIGKELENKTTAQLTTVVIDSIGDTTVEEYAVQLFRKWGIGQKDKDNGVLLLVAIKDRVMRIEVGYGLEGAIPDGKAGRIRDEYIIPYFKQEDYSKGIYYGYLALAREIAKEYNAELTFDIDSELQAIDNETMSKNGIVLIAVIIMFIIIIFLSIKNANYTGPKGPTGPGGFGGFTGSGGLGGSRSSGGFGGGSSGGGGASGKW
ncbi:MAG: TPM domain-containing protein [Fervidobacterium sp.]